MKSCQISQEKTCVGVFFNKSAGPQNYSFIKRDSNTGFFSVNFVNYSRTPVEDLRTAGSETPVRFFKKTLFYRTSPVYTSNSFRFPTCNFSKKETRKRCFSVNFAKFLWTSFNRTPQNDCLLCLSVTFEKLFTSFIEHLWETASFM